MLATTSKILGVMPNHGALYTWRGHYYLTSDNDHWCMKSLKPTIIERPSAVIISQTC